MAKHSITLVGRVSWLQCHSDHASFLLTVNAKGVWPKLVIKCHAHRQRDIEAFESMNDGCLVGIIGTLQPVEEQHTHPIVRLDRLEILSLPIISSRSSR